MKTEQHFVAKSGWLRAAVLGANDGILSTSSLILGVAAANPHKPGLIIAGLAGLVAGALSMASGEYVSVSSQADSAQADLRRERAELRDDPAAEHRELAAIYVGRGLEPALARQVADKLMAKDTLGAHARDELGITDQTKARPIQAALASATSFSVGAALPLAAVLFAPTALITLAIAVGSLIFLGALGAVGAWTGGAPLWRGAWRVFVLGAVAMAVTTGVGALVGHAV
jgi:VIT1/CCC1 family predicted Fe2+/Mn2+ transporter